MENYTGNASIVKYPAKDNAKISLIDVHIGKKKLTTSGTGNMKCHLASQHGKRVSQDSDINGNQLITTMLQQTRPTWSQATSNELLTHLIINENLSFQIVESISFREYVQYQRRTNFIPTSGDTIQN